MKILITGICGFVGGAVVRYFHQHRPEWSLAGIDNLSRMGSETNVHPLKNIGVDVRTFDVCNHRETVPSCDWLIHCAANPRVTAGIDGDTYSVVHDNFESTRRLLEYCRVNNSGFIFISTSRVYSMLSHCGYRTHGIPEEFPAVPPLSLYGTTKRMSEMLALEFAGMFNFPLYINRCGLMAGKGQFGNINQGIVSHWIKSWRDDLPLKYTGHKGEATRDLMHPDDLASLLVTQIERQYDLPIIANVSGGAESSWSLDELSEWCDNKFGPRYIARDPEPRPFDVQWLVLDNSRAKQIYGWSPTRTKHDIWEEIANA